MEYRRICQPWKGYLEGQLIVFHDAGEVYSFCINLRSKLSINFAHEYSCTYIPKICSGEAIASSLFIQA